MFWLWTLDSCHTHCNEPGLSRLTTDEKLHEAFLPFGQIVDGTGNFYSLWNSFVRLFDHLDLLVFMILHAAKVVTDRVSGRSKGFGFITYTTVEEAEKAREGMNAKFLDGWVIFVDPAKPREPRPPPEPQSQPSETGFTSNKTIGWCGWHSKISL